jgi:hypothetical protein
MKKMPDNREIPGLVIVLPKNIASVKNNLVFFPETLTLWAIQLIKIFSNNKKYC